MMHCDRQVPGWLSLQAELQSWGQRCFNRVNPGHCKGWAHMWHLHCSLGSMRIVGNSGSNSGSAPRLHTELMERCLSFEFSQGYRRNPLSAPVQVPAPLADTAECHTQGIFTVKREEPKELSLKSTMETFAVEAIKCPKWKVEWMRIRVAKAQAPGQCSGWLCQAAPAPVSCAQWHLVTNGMSLSSRRDSYSTDIRDFVTSLTTFRVLGFFFPLKVQKFLPCQVSV